MYINIIRPEIQCFWKITKINELDFILLRCQIIWPPSSSNGDQLSWCNQKDRCMEGVELQLYLSCTVEVDPLVKGKRMIIFKYLALVRHVKATERSMAGGKRPRGPEHRRRIYTEEKAKIVAAVWRTELIQFLAVVAFLHQDDLKKRLILPSTK